MLPLIIGIFFVVASDCIQTYHIALVGYLACGLVATTSSVNALVYAPEGAREAAAAGFILLSMVNVSAVEFAPNSYGQRAFQSRICSRAISNQLCSRLYGYSTSDLRLRPCLEHTWIRLLSLKNRRQTDRL